MKAKTIAVVLGIWIAVSICQLGFAPQGAAAFDVSKTLTVTGTVTEFISRATPGKSSPQMLHLKTLTRANGEVLPLFQQ